MVLMVHETEALADGVLPVAELAAQMRLPEGYAAVPGQDARLQLRLRAAITFLERRLGRILLARDVVLAGVVNATRVTLPVAPVSAIVSVQELRPDAPVMLDGARLEVTGQGADLILPGSRIPGGPLRVTVLAGWADWDAVPGALAQAVLSTAEALDEGSGPILTQAVEALIAPWKSVRLGGRAQ
ncbi:hypothetical protein [Jannaschia sp. M317]|uniref:head-tail connector protein n=1 Tax=Jannaschia sp. M317 TaxID=2867011 RepID=UPI0021A6B92F|nr:hypothetical protein [Jannaschia sp. M317]UWQ16990.1 hypothetical protein K3551_13970 [Jannaschia sp. M317]